MDRARFAELRKAQQTWMTSAESVATAIRDAKAWQPGKRMWRRDRDGKRDKDMRAAK